MFDQEFFPTPPEVIEIMLEGIEIKGKRFLEPSAGNGKIIDVLNERGGITYSCEWNEDLAKLVSAKSEFINGNFLRVRASHVSHIDYIIMNPPFSNASEHILHAYDIMPKGCSLVSLCNEETILNPYSKERERLAGLVDEDFELLGDCFSDAERKTGVRVAMVKLSKAKDEEEDEFGDYLSDDEEPEHLTQGIIGHNVIREYVGRYIQAVQLFDETMNAKDKINEVMKPIGGSFSINFNATQERENGQYSQLPRDTFKKTLQKSAWREIFRAMKMENSLTSSAMEKVNRMVEVQTHKPFTEKNVWKMIEMIYGTREDRFKKTILEAFDWLTQYHDGNRLNLKGWKTNESFFVGKKFIAPRCGLKMSYQGTPEIDWGDNNFDDVTKALCHLTGGNWQEDYSTLRNFFEPIEVPNDEAQNIIDELSLLLNLSEEKTRIIHSFFKYFDKDKGISQDLTYRLGKYGFSINKVKEIEKFYIKGDYDSDCFGKKLLRKEWSTWYDWGFFTIKVYKGGTMHCKFKEEKIWELFNLTASKFKGWQIPEDTKSKFRRKGTEVEIYN